MGDQSVGSGGAGGGEERGRHAREERGKHGRRRPSLTPAGATVVCFVLEATRERIGEIAWARGLSKATSTWHVGAREPPAQTAEGYLRGILVFVL